MFIITYFGQSKQSFFTSLFLLDRFIKSYMFTLTDFVGLAADSLSDIKSPSDRRDHYSEDTISFSEVDTITPAQKMLARQLTCDIVPGKSLLVTG